MVTVAVNCECARVGGTRAHLGALLDGAEAATDLPARVVPLALGYPPGSFSTLDDARIVATPLPLAERLRWERRRLPAALSEVGADVLLHPSNVRPLARLAIPRVQILHNIAPLVRPLREVARGRLYARLAVLWALTHASVRSTAGMVYLSQTAMDLARAWGWSGRGALIRPGLPTLPAAAEREPVVVVVAHLFRYKRVEDAVIAFGRSGLARRGFELHVYGGPYDRPYAARLLRRATDQPGVSFLGARPPEEARAAVGRAAAVIQPSSCENAPQVVYEALAAGTPLVASDIPAHAELLRSGLYPTGDVDALAALLPGAVAGGPNKPAVAIEPWTEVARRIVAFCAEVT